MKKKLLIAVMLIICLLSLFACSESFSYQALPGGPNINDEIVGGNSGICVQKGDYIYMINGMADTTADNNFGDAVRGAIYRLELNPATGEIIETLLMAPKAFYSKEQGAGLYIPDNGNKLYYISPSTEKDKNGDRLYWYYDIFSVNLNGTETRKMGTIDYYNTGKFLQIGSEVCFVYEPTIIDKTDNKILAMKENGQIVECLKGYEKAIIGEDGNIYYTKEQEKDADKEISGIEDYNKVYKKAVLGEDEEIKLGAENLSEDKYLVQLQKFEDGVLYYTKNKKAGASPLELLFAYRNGEEIQLTSSEQSDPYFLGFDNNGFYLGTLFIKDNHLVLIKASEKNEDPSENGKIYYIAGGVSGQPTYLFKDDTKNELYFILNNKLHKVKIPDELNDSNSKIEQLLDTDMNIEKLYPKMLGNYIYFIGSGDKEYYKDYLHRMDIREPKDQEPVRLGELSKADQELKDEDEDEAD